MYAVDVVLKNDRRKFNDEVPEEALRRLGFQLKHITDKPDADEARVRKALGR